MLEAQCVSFSPCYPIHVYYRTINQVEREDQCRVHGHRRGAGGGVRVEGSSASPDGGHAANDVFDLSGAHQGSL